MILDKHECKQNKGLYEVLRFKDGWFLTYKAKHKGIKALNFCPFCGCLLSILGGKSE